MTAPREAWDAALANYKRLRAIEEAIPLDDRTGVGDKAVEDWCAAMDDLIANVRAPDLAAVLIKIDLGRSRAEGFSESLFTDHVDGIVADIRALAAAPTGEPSA